MKKFSLIICLALTMSASAFAGQQKQAAHKSGIEGNGHYGVSGCGLGSMLFENKHGKVEQVLAATTNGTSGNQTFGITTGTLNCSTDGVVAQHAEKEMFVSANYDNLSHDMAAGKGESLNAFASLMGCSKASAKTFGVVTQKHYKEIFSAPARQPQDIVSNTQAIIIRDVQLAKACPQAAL